MPSLVLLKNNLLLESQISKTLFRIWKEEAVESVEKRNSI